MKTDWPKVIRSGSVTVKIYQVPNNGYPQHVISYYLGTRRVRKVITEFAEAKEEAERIAKRLSRGDQEALKLTGTDSLAFVQAQRLLKPLNMPLLAAIEEYVEAKKLGVPLLPAAKLYANRQKAVVARKTVSEIVEEFLQTKRADGMSKAYLIDCDHRLGRFAKDMKVEIGTIDTPTIMAWLRGLKLSGRSQNNFRAQIKSLFLFARSQGYLVKNEPTAAEDLSLAKDRGGEIGIFKSAEFAQLLVADPVKLKVLGKRKYIVPYLILGGFAGLRHAEITRLDWQDINLEEKIVHVSAAKAKTGSRRIVPLCDNAIAWLTPHRETKGRVCPDDETRNAREICRKLKIEWPKNGLRHSYGSYRLAQVKSAPQVALEMGNSPQMVFAHYRQVVTETEAIAWFAISPAHPKNVIQIAQPPAQAALSA